MDGYQFIASVLGSLAWPATAFAIGLAFRKVIIDLIPHITTFKAGGVEVSIAERSEKAVEPIPITASGVLPSNNFRAIPSQPDQFPGADVRDVSEYGNLLGVVDETSGLVKQLSISGEVGPSGTILLSWLEFERDIRKLCSDFGLEAVRDIYRAAKQLHDKGIITSEVLSAIRSLRAVRNSVAHEKEPVSQADAVQFVASLAEVRRNIRSIERPEPFSRYEVKIAEEMEPVFAAMIRKEAGLLHYSFLDMSGTMKSWIITRYPSDLTEEKIREIAKSIDPAAEVVAEKSS